MADGQASFRLAETFNPSQTLCPRRVSRNPIQLAVESRDPFLLGGERRPCRSTIEYPPHGFFRGLSPSFVPSENRSTSDKGDPFCPTPDPISTNRCRKGQVLLCGVPRSDPRIAFSDTKAKKASAKTPAVRTLQDDGGIKGADREEDDQNVKCPSTSSASLPKPTAFCQFVPR